MYKIVALLLVLSCAGCESGTGAECEAAVRRAYTWTGIIAKPEYEARMRCCSRNVPSSYTDCADFSLPPTVTNDVKPRRNPFRRPAEDNDSCSCTSH